VRGPPRHSSAMPPPRNQRRPPNVLDCERGQAGGNARRTAKPTTSLGASISVVGPRAPDWRPGDRIPRGADTWKSSACDMTTRGTLLVVRSVKA